MTTMMDLERSIQRTSWLRRLVLGALPVVVAFVSAGPAAKADLIEKYGINTTAQVSGYGNGAFGSYITVTGQFLFDSTLGYVTSVNLNVTGNLNNGYLLPTNGITIDTARTGNEDANDLSAQSSDGLYSIRFEFANALSLAGNFDSVLNTPGTDNGDAQFYDALAGSSGDTTYHIGYYGVSGGAVPEPASILLFGSSLLGLAFVRRRASGKRLSA